MHWPRSPRRIQSFNHRAHQQQQGPATGTPSIKGKRILLSLHLVKDYNKVYFFKNCFVTKFADTVKGFDQILQSGSKQRELFM